MFFNSLLRIFRHISDVRCNYRLQTTPSGLILWLKYWSRGLFYRSVGCTWNDVVDREMDRHVARCSIRPAALGALSIREGYISAAVQYLVLFSVMVPTSLIGLLYLAPLIIMGTLYTYAKRFTNCPLLILGLVSSSGILVGSAVMKVDPMSLRYSDYALAFLSLMGSYTI